MIVATVYPHRLSLPRSFKSHAFIELDCTPIRN